MIYFASPWVILHTIILTMRRYGLWNCVRYVDTPHEYSRIALAYDLANEYTASGGDKLEEIYG